MGADLLPFSVESLATNRLSAPTSASSAPVAHHYLGSHSSTPLYKQKKVSCIRKYSAHWSVGDGCQQLASAGMSLNPAGTSRLHAVPANLIG